MNIQEACEQALTSNNYCIARESWIYSTPFDDDWNFRLLLFPTNTPNGCILYDTTTHHVKPLWQPRMTDLLADNWRVVDCSGFKRPVKKE